jgi:hypothetical protein
VLLIGGIVAAAAGVVLYETQNHPDYALATAGAGGGLALSGVIVLTF